MGGDLVERVARAAHQPPETRGYGRIAAVEMHAPQTVLHGQRQAVLLMYAWTALLCVAGLAFVTSCESSSHDDDDQPTAEEQSQMLTEEQATALVFRLAGVSASEVSNLRVETDRDDGVLEYEVKFTVGNREYEYEIDAITGALRGTEIE